MTKTFFLISIILLSSGINIDAQTEANKIKQIDSLFMDWNTPNHPGGSVGVMQGNQVIYSKAYGLASLEYLVPNQTGTRYNIASVSKQFTAMGIVLLDLQGKLSIDDDIRKHIQDLPDFGETVTIRHMLHHTSGLRSLHALLAIAGWRGDDTRTNEDLLRLMKNQLDLNFKPGEEYLYCNTGYIFMALIIENITGEKFANWMFTNVFEPLGMISTYVEDNYMRVVPQNATSYFGNTDRGFERAVEYWGYTGSGNIHSTTEDLLRWQKNFYDPAKGWAEAFEKLQTLDKFNNGRENNYAFGVSLDEYKGHKRVQHGGSIGGFRSFSCTFPEEELSIVVLTNFSSGGPGSRANSIADILLDKRSFKMAENPDIDIKTIHLTDKDLEQYTGYYWNDKENYIRRIYLRNDTLRYFRSAGSESALVPVSDSEFRMIDVGGEVWVRFSSDDTGIKMIVSIENELPIEMDIFEPAALDDSDKMKYRGLFYSPELDVYYYIHFQDEKLFCSHPRHGNFELSMLKHDVFEGRWPLSVLKFQITPEGIVTGMKVTNGRVRDLWFEKIEY